MIENNLLSVWRFGIKKRILFSFFSTPKNNQQYYYPIKYDLNYMMSKYSDKSRYLTQWINQHITSDENIKTIHFSTIDCLSYLKTNHLDYLKNIYVIDRCFNSFVPFKISFRKILSGARTKLHDKTRFNLSSDSIDIVYSNIPLNSFPKSSRSNVLSETLRVLNSEGKFCFSMVTNDFYDSIYELLGEFDDIFAQSILQDQRTELTKDEIFKFLKTAFLEVKIEDVKTNWWVTDADDLIGYLLSDKQFLNLRIIISQYGLSRFRKFLIQKIKKDGGISITRNVVFVSGKNKFY